MSQKIIDTMSKYGLRKMLYTQSLVCSKEEIEGERTSSRIHNILATRLERRGKVKEAIQIYRQAAIMYPPEGYKSLKNAAELAQNNCMNEEAAELWFESIYYTSNFLLKLKSLVELSREYLRSKP